MGPLVLTNVLQLRLGHALRPPLPSADPQGVSLRTIERGLMRFTRTVLLVSLLALVVVPAAFAIRLTDDSYFMPTGHVGEPYSKTFGGAGGCGPALPYQYTLIGGTMPPGLSLSFSGTISGTPTSAGSYSFWVNLSDQNPPSADWCRPAEAQREFTIVVEGGGSPAAVPLSIVPTSLAPAATVVGTPYSFQLSAQGGGSQTWSLVSGSLPSAVQLGANGLISGTPTAAGDFSFKVQVSDGTRTASQSYTLTVVPPLKIGAVTVPAGEVLRPFKLQLGASGGKAGYSWSLAGGTTLPAGVTLDGKSGVISGAPSVAGSFPVKLSVTDSLGFTDTVDVNLSFAPKLAITTKKLRSAKAGRAFSARLVTVGGVPPRGWKIVRGSLPAGVHFSTRTGIFSGMPRRAGKSTLVVQVTDTLGAVSRVTLVLNVHA
jgi:large repetitive protein